MATELTQAEYLAQKTEQAIAEFTRMLRATIANAELTDAEKMAIVIGGERAANKTAGALEHAADAAINRSYIATSKAVQEAVAVIMATMAHPAGAQFVARFDETGAPINGAACFVRSDGEARRTLFGKQSNGNTGMASKRPRCRITIDGIETEHKDRAAAMRHLGLGDVSSEAQKLLTIWSQVVPGRRWELLPITAPGPINAMA